MGTGSPTAAHGAVTQNQGSAWSWVADRAHLLAVGAVMRSRLKVMAAQIARLRMLFYQLDFQR